MRLINGYLTSRNVKRTLIYFYNVNKGFIWFVLMLFVIRSTLLNWNYIPSASMNPNLVEGDLVLVNKIAFDIKLPFIGVNLIAINHPARGDIVAFERKDRLYVKRVMAVPGDTVEIINNAFYINGTELPLKATSLAIINNNALPYSSQYSFSAYQESTVIAPAKRKKNYDVIFANRLPAHIKDNLVNNSAEFTIPIGKYFMIGDNRYLSHDSRYFGLIERNQIVGCINTVIFNYQQLWKKITQQKTMDKLRVFQEIT